MNLHKKSYVHSLLVIGVYSLGLIGIAACGGSSSGGGGGGSGSGGSGGDADGGVDPPRPTTVVVAQLPERLSGSEAGLRAILAIDGGTALAMTVSGNEARAEVELADGPHDFAVTWLANDGTVIADFELASATTNVTIGDPVFNADIAADAYAYGDDDGDLFSNIAELSAGSDLTDAGDTPVMSRMVVPGTLETAGVTEIFGTDMGGTRIKLSPTLQPSGSANTSFLVSPDGRYVALTADATDDNINDVYVVPVDGSTPAVKVSSVGFVIVPGTTFISASSLQWAPDSSRIAWRGDFRADNVTELFTATPTGSQQAVNGPMVPNGNVNSFIWSPDSTRLAYRADQDTDNVLELYTAFPDGTGRLKVSGPMALDGDVSTFGWAPDSSRLAYISDEDLDNQIELFTADPAVAGSAIRVSLNPVHPDADVSSNFIWAPDSSRIAYTHDRDTDGVNDLYTTVPDSAAQVFKINKTSLIAGQFQSISFAWSPDSTLLAYRGDVETDNVNELFIDTFNSQRASPKVSGTLVGMGGVSEFEWSPDGSQLVFTADANIDQILEVFSVDSAAGTPRLLLSPSAVTTDSVNANILQFTADGSRVVFFAEHDVDNATDLFSATPGVANSAVNLSQLSVPAAPPGGSSSGSASISGQFSVLSPDSRTAFYQEATFFNDGINPATQRQNVHTTPVDGSGPIIDLIADNTEPTGSPFTNGWTLAGERAAFVHNLDTADLIGLELISTKADGSGLINHTAPVVDNGAQSNFAQNAGELPETEDNDDTGRAQVLPFPLPVAGTVSPTDEDFFRFTPPVSGTYEFQLSTTAGVNIEIRDSDGLTVLPGGSGAKLVRPALTAGSTYFVKLSGNGDYRFAFGQQRINNP